jgi:hypothetical protein
MNGIGLARNIARNASQSRFPSLWNGLVLAYAPRLGPNGQRLIEVARNRNGTLTSGAYFAPSARGPVVALDGSDDFVDCGNPNVVAFGSGNFSISAWIKPNNVTTAQCFIGKDDAAVTGRQFGFILRNSVNGALTFFWNQSDIVSRVAETAGSVVSAGAWHHIVGIRDGSTSLKIYVNGNSLSVTLSGTATGSMQSSVSTLCIGKRTYVGFNNPFGGQIGNVMFYNRALTPQEVSRMYAGASPFVSRWKPSIYNLATTAAPKYRMFFSNF